MKKEKRVGVEERRATENGEMDGEGKRGGERVRERED